MVCPCRLLEMMGGCFVAMCHGFGLDRAINRCLVTRFLLSTPVVLSMLLCPAEEIQREREAAVPVSARSAVQKSTSGDCERVNESAVLDRDF